MTTDEERQARETCRREMEAAMPLTMAEDRKYRQIPATTPATTATPATEENNASKDLISARGRIAAREAVQRMRAGQEAKRKVAAEQQARRRIAASWAQTIDELNRNHRLK